MALNWTRPPAGAGIPPTGGLGDWILGADLDAEELRRVRRTLTGVGAAALILGVVAILVPAIASVTIAVFIGWVLVAAGAVMGIQAVSHRAVLRGLEALLTLIAGLYVVIFPLNGTVTLTFVLAVWLFATGALALFGAIRARHMPLAWTLGISGVLSVVLGLLIAVSLPSSAAWAIGLLVGIDLITSGVRALFAARLLKESEPPATYPGR